MRLHLFTFLCTALAIQAHAAESLPPELIGEWRSADGNGILAFRADGFGVVIGGPPPIGVPFQASYDPKTSAITLKLQVSQGELPKGAQRLPDLQLSYEPKELTIKMQGNPIVAYKRHSEKFPEYFNPFEPKTPWEKEWADAWAIGHGAGADSQKAIDHVLEAIRLSPKDNEKLGTLWDYLGHLYLDRKDYGRAESAFKSHLALIQDDSKPKEQLSLYQALGVLYARAGNIDGHKEALHKSITLNRSIHGGDSAQEAGCWQQLAEVTHSSGNSKEAAEMLAQAIEMYSKVNDKVAPLHYFRRKLEKWRKE